MGKKCDIKRIVGARMRERKENEKNNNDYSEETIISGVSEV